MSTERRGVALDIPRVAWAEVGDWNESGDPKSRMLASVYVYGVLHHLDAIEVTENDHGEIRAANPDWEEMLDSIWRGFDPGDQYETVTIDDRKYLLFMSPSC